MPDDLGATGAQGGTHGDLVALGLGPDEKQIGDVGERHWIEALRHRWD